MNPTLKKAILVMVGAASLTKEKVDSFIDELKKEGALNEEEGRELAKNLLSKGEKQARDISEEVRREVKKALAEMGVTSKEHPHHHEHPEHDHHDHPHDHKDCECKDGECDCEEGCDCKECGCSVCVDETKN